jgi:putative transposase
MVESFHGLYKWELIYPQGPWRGLDDVEYATLGYIDWFNHRRLHGEITNDNNYLTPAEFEAAYDRQETPATRRSTNRPGSHQNRGGSVDLGRRSLTHPPGPTRPAMTATPADP